MGLVQVLRNSFRKLGDLLVTKYIPDIEKYEIERYSPAKPPEKKEFFISPQLQAVTTSPIDVFITSVFSALKGDICKKISIQSLPVVLTYFLIDDNIRPKVDTYKNGQNVKLDLYIPTKNRTPQEIAFDALKLTWDGYVEAYCSKKTTLLGKRYLFELVIFPKGLLVNEMVFQTNDPIYWVLWLEDLKELGKDHE